MSTASMVSPRCSAGISLANEAIARGPHALGPEVVSVRWVRPARLKVALRNSIAPFCGPDEIFAETGEAGADHDVGPLESRDELRHAGGFMLPIGVDLNSNGVAVLDGAPVPGAHGSAHA